MKRPAAFVLLAVLAAAPFALAGPAADKHIQKGNEAVQKKDYKKAVKEYEAAVKAEPENSKAHLLLGLTYATTGELDKAVRFSESSIRLEPSYAAYHNLGLIHANRADYAQAVKAYENAVRMNPEAFRTWYQLGLIYAAKGDFGRAVDSYRKAVELNPRFFDAYLGLGSAYYWSGDKDSAFQQVARLKMMNANEQAAGLESWIQNRERKKLESSASTPAEPAAPPTT